MSRYAWTSVVASMVGIVVPIRFLIMESSRLEEPNPWMLVAIMALWPSLPFVLFLATVWSNCGNLRRSQAIAVHTVAQLLLALVCWSWAGEDPKGINLVVTGVLLPIVQICGWAMFLIWLVIRNHASNGRGGGMLPAPTGERPA